MAVTLDGSAASCTVDTGTGAVSCPTSGLAEGVHSWNYTFKDKAGNTRPHDAHLHGRSDRSDRHPSCPERYHNVTDADVAVYYADAGSGVNAASVSVYWRARIPAPRLYAEYASCPQSGLLEGAHDSCVTIADNAGNTGTGTGSFFVDTLLPAVPR